MAAIFACCGEAAAAFLPVCGRVLEQNLFVF
jgi:hypothetical protein